MRIFERSIHRDVARASMVLALLVASPSTRIARDSAEPLTLDPRNPDFGPNVTTFASTMPAATIQAKLDTVFKTQESSEFA